MATPEALVKYYDCLRESFNKIQAKDNETALVNAALRPKIREEFRKSTDLLVSYLEYIKVFSLIYREKFVIICSNILVPLFKENPYRLSNPEYKDHDVVANNSCGISAKLHEAIRSTIASSPDLAKDFVHILVKVFPTIDQESTKQQLEFTNYLSNFLEATLYLNQQQLQVAVSTLIERINPILTSTEDTEDTENTENPEDLTALETIRLAYDMIYEHLDKHLGEECSKSLTRAFISCFASEFVAQPLLRDFHYLLLYMFSHDEQYSTNLIQSLWDVFIDESRSLEDRLQSITFASSFISRAAYVSLDTALQHLERESQWCHESFLLRDDQAGIGVKDTNETVKAFFALSHSIFYVVTQRFREMYEDETICRLNKLNLDRIVASKFEPLNHCDSDTRRRFLEIATLFQLTKLDQIPTKRRKSDLGVANSWRKRPFDDSSVELPTRIEPLYRRYYDHRNFTVYRE